MNTEITKLKRQTLTNKGELICLQNPTLGNAFTNICTGFGLDSELPVRIGAYALPALQQAENSFLAETEFYIARAFAQNLNGLPTEIAERNTQLLQEYISLLRCNLNLATQPIWLREANPYSDDRLKLLRSLAEILKANGSERITRFATSRDGDDSLTYMAAHALYMWDVLDVDQNQFIIERSTTPKSLLMIGGPAEKIFYEARQTLIGNYPTVSDRKATQGFSEIGRRPPYYPIENELIFGFRQQLELKDVLAIANPDVLRDTLFLLISLSEGLNFADISKIKKGKLTPDEQADLESSCIRLQKILSQLES